MHKTQDTYVRQLASSTWYDISVETKFVFPMSSKAEPIPTALSHGLRKYQSRPPLTAVTEGNTEERLQAFS